MVCLGSVKLERILQTTLNFSVCLDCFQKTLDHDERDKYHSCFQTLVTPYILVSICLHLPQGKLSKYANEDVSLVATGLLDVFPPKWFLTLLKYL